jgi:hypothetical protein
MGSFRIVRRHQGNQKGQADGEPRSEEELEGLPWFGHGGILLCSG